MITTTAQKIKVSIKNFFSKCDQTHKKLRIWSHFLKKYLMENFIFCAVSRKSIIFYFDFDCIFTGRDYEILSIWLRVIILNNKFLFYFIIFHCFVVLPKIEWKSSQFRLITSDIPWKCQIKTFAVRFLPLTLSRIML